MRKLIVSIVIVFGMSTHAHSQVWKQYIDTAKAYAGNKNTDTAIVFYLKALDVLKKDSAGTWSYAQVCDSLGISFYRKNQTKEAKKFYLEAKQIQEKVSGRQNPDYATSCYYLGTIYMRMGQFDSAEAYSIEGKLIREKVLGKENIFYAASCNRLASIYYFKGQYDKAEPQYLEAKKIQENILGKEDIEYAGTCNNLALLYMTTDRYAEAEALTLEAMKIRERTLGKDDAEYASSCNNLALLYINMGQLEKAKPLYVEAKKTRETSLGKENQDYAQSCDNLGKLYEFMGSYEKAEPLYLEAKEIREKVLGKENPDYAQSCDNLAELYEHMGQYKKAEIISTEAKQIREKVLGKDNPDYAQSCDNLAKIYMDLEEYNRAEPLYLEAKQILKNGSGKDYAIICSDLGELYIDSKQYKKAEAVSLEARQVSQKILGKDNLFYAYSCDNLGSLYQDMGQYEKARPFFVEGKEIKEKQLGKLHPNYGLSCENLATLYWAMHQPLWADKAFKESFAVNSYNLNAVFQFTNEKEKGEFIKNVSGQDDKAYSFYISEKLPSEQPYSLSLFYRNLILSSSQALNRQLFYASDSKVVNKYNDWLSLKRYLSVLYAKPINERKEDLAKIEDSAGILEKQLTRISSGFKKQQQNVSWKDISSKLQTGEAAIEFISFHFYIGSRYTDSVFYAAIIVRKNIPSPAMVFLFNEKKLTDIVSHATGKPTNDGIEELYTLGEIENAFADKSIYDLVWKPLEKQLKGITTVYFSPAGLLHKIAFAALPVNKNVILSDRYKLVQLASTSSVTDQIPAFITPSDNFQLYGGIRYDADSASLVGAIRANTINKEKTTPASGDGTRGSSFSYLPGTKAEIEAIEKQALNTHNKVSALSGLNAAEESFKALDGTHSPSVIHIATHGFFFPDPKENKEDSIQLMFETSGKIFKQSDNPLFRSGLLFAGANNAWKGKPVEGVEDGILTAYEVSNMYLPNTKLVVLSACETALGDIQGSEGVYGLQRAFKIAGVQNLVMSLWKVPDAETEEFMQLFYQNLFNKQSISDAFYYAQTVMKNKYRNDPYKWAAWILIR